MQLPLDYTRLLPHEKREVRLEYIRLQGNLCYHCKGSLDEQPPKHITDKKINWRMFPTGFLNHPVHLHHSHIDNMTIGAVHAYCNAVLWQYHGE